MTQEETRTLLAILSSTYSVHLMPQVTKVTIGVWSEVLKGASYPDITQSALAWIATNKFPPTPADLLEMATKLTQPDEMSGDEAFGLVTQAARQFGLSGSRKAHEFLGDRIWEIVTRMGWGTYCMMDEYSHTTEYAQFRAAYENESKKQRERAQIPAHIREKLLTIGNGTASKLIEEKSHDTD